MRQKKMGIFVESTEQTQLDKDQTEEINTISESKISSVSLENSVVPTIPPPPPPPPQLPAPQNKLKIPLSKPSKVSNQKYSNEPNIESVLEELKKKQLLLKRKSSVKEIDSDNNLIEEKNDQIETDPKSNGMSIDERINLGKEARKSLNF
ncbi:hypothetical protein MHBO_000197 [Bonamia ostreae]|uniref:WH2 domain-containing protein n=1 Tax=Bonamia ostreae TaxID=126728 RepID=A0ABV2AEQ8_9EUKA